MNEIWDAKRKHLEKAVIEAVLNLFQHSGGAGAFKLPILGTSPQVFIIAGDEKAINSLTPNEQLFSPRAELTEAKRAVFDDDTVKRLKEKIAVLQQENEVLELQLKVTW